MLRSVLPTQGGPDHCIHTRNSKLMKYKHRKKVFHLCRMQTPIPANSSYIKKVTVATMQSVRMQCIQRASLHAFLMGSIINVYNSCVQAALLQPKNVVFTVCWSFLLPQLHIVTRFSFSRYIAFSMHLDIHYV